MITLKSRRELDIMRAASNIVAHILEELRAHCKIGVTTHDLDRIAEERTLAAGAQPAFKGYRGFPRSLCTSINQEVVHGIPGNRVLRDGDIVGLDFGVIYQGYYGDAAVTVPIGNIPPEVQQLLEVTEQCLYLGIEQMVPGKHLSDISRAIQTHAEAHGFSLVREFGGHGIGKSLHEDPMVLNYVVNGRGIKLKPGLVLAIEPMVNMGAEQVHILPDGWTVVTTDGAPSAHFEHTIAITESGHEILTKVF
ncbi:MAG TPA: type I methionyl aminopeptidase [Acidobacteriota bacterium]|nr:type I methionyl aminopeptidase [Acidobacteriota bacterium]